MKTTIIQTVKTILNEDRTLISSSTTEAYVLTPKAGYVLKNIKTGEIITTRICVHKKVKLSDYIEIEDPNTL